MEEAWSEKGALKSADAALRKDSSRMNQTAKQLDQALADIRHSRELDEDVVRLRRREGPGKRLAVRP